MLLNDMYTAKLWIFSFYSLLNNKYSIFSLSFSFQIYFMDVFQHFYLFYNMLLVTFSIEQKTKRGEHTFWQKTQPNGVHIMRHRISYHVITNYCNWWFFIEICCNCYLDAFSWHFFSFGVGCLLKLSFVYCWNCKI